MALLSPLQALLSGGVGDTSPDTAPSLQSLQLKQRLAEGLLGNAGDSTPVASPWAAANRALSPLLGALLERDTGKQLDALNQGASNEYGTIIGSADPIAAIAHSNNPLVRAMLPDLIQKKIEASLTPHPLEWHAPTENAYDARGHLVVQGTPELKAPPTRIIPQGGIEITQELQPDGSWKELGRRPIWDPTAGAGKPKPDKLNPLGIVPPWQLPHPGGG